MRKSLPRSVPTIANLKDLQENLAFATEFSNLLQKYKVHVWFSYHSPTPPLLLKIKDSVFDFGIKEGTGELEMFYQDHPHFNYRMGTISKEKDSTLLLEEEKPGSDASASDHPDDNLGQQDFSAPGSRGGKT